MWNEKDEKNTIQIMYHTVCLDDFYYNEFVDYLKQIYDSIELIKHIEILNDVLRSYLIVTIAVISNFIG
jgi:two-component SAPR family response regulator